MKGYLDNLRPFERRLVVAVGVMVFIVLNFAFVFPHFSDWAKVKDRKANAERTLEKFQGEIQQTNAINKLVVGFESEGAGVPPEEQASEFSRTIQVLAGQYHVNIINSQQMTDHTTPYFIEKSQPLILAGKEEDLVNFLYNLGAGNSLIRVRGLNIHPDVPQRQNLNVNVTLLASFQKKMSVRAAPAAARPVATSGVTVPTASAAKATSTAK
jgi:hypothetical protein